MYFSVIVEAKDAAIRCLDVYLKAPTFRCVASSLFSPLRSMRLKNCVSINCQSKASMGDARECDAVHFRCRLPA